MVKVKQISGYLFHQNHENNITTKVEDFFNNVKIKKIINISYVKLESQYYDVICFIHYI